MKKVWNEHYDNLIRRHYPKGDVDALAKRLGVTKAAVKSRASRLGIKRKTWSDKHVKYLLKHYLNTPTEEICRKLGRTPENIYRKARKLGLRKPIEYFVHAGQKGAKHPNSIATRFQKGSVPKNKGKRQEQFMSKEGKQNSIRTRFKKGHRPHNTKPVGYEHTHKDGYVYIKVAENEKMVLKHRYVWQQANGEIPKGYCIAFRDGNRSNCELSNLYLISREDKAKKQIENEDPETRRKRMAKCQETRNKTIRRDRIRIHWGLEPYSKLVKRW